MRTKTIYLLLFIFITTINANAQSKRSEFKSNPQKSRFSIEVNSGASISTNKIWDTKQNIGFGFETLLHYRVLQNTGLYTGWGWNRFQPKDTFIGTFEETGYIFGIQHKRPIFKSPIEFYIRLGALYNHIEIEDKNGDLLWDTNHGFGFQGAAGINYNISQRWSIAPGIKYNNLSRNIKSSEDPRGETKLTHNYISIRIGLIYNL